MFLALNEIMKEKSRFILITVVIILVSYLVFFLTALAFGLATSYTTAIDKWAADSIVLSENANNNIGRSLLFGEDYQDLLSEEVAAIGVGTATVEVDESEDVSLFGIDRNSFLMPDLKSGASFETDKEVVVSDKLEAIGVSVGSKLTLQGGKTE